MFVIKDKDIPLPTPYPRVYRKLPTVKESGWTRFDNFTIRKDIDLCPQPGLQEKVVASECNLIFLAGEATMGKGADYKSLISTPNGWVTMGSLVVGSEISDTESGIQTVEQIYELGETDLFLVKMHDGSSCRCTREHLWKYKITKQHHKAKWTVGTLEELIEVMEEKEDSQHVYIPLPDPVFYEQKEKLPIHPYVLGAMLGDGCMSNTLSSAYIHCPDIEILDRFRELGYPTKRYCKCGHKIQDSNFVSNLKKLNLWGCLAATKFIPGMYKFASIENRTELLRGLMDTDGNVEKFHVLRYSTISLSLAKDIQELVWSLGGNCTINKKLPHYTYKGERLQGVLSYYLNINLKNADNYVTLPKKKERCVSQYRRGQTELSREIIGIEHIGKEKCRCIRVSNPNRLYITDNYIVTHNTFSGYLKALNGIDKPNYTAKLISKRLQDSKKGGSLLRDFKVVFDGFAGCEVSGADYPTAAFPQWNSSIQMMHMNYNTKNESEWKEFQDYAKKNQCSYAYWDEVTEIEEFRTFAYFFSRNRDASGVRPTTVCSFNALHEHWTTSFLKQGGYIGPDWYLIPETLGKIRYFYVKGDTVEAVEFADTRDELVRRCKLQPTPEEEAIGITAHDLVKSFTVFSGYGADNRILVHQTGGGSIANLYNVGETERLKIKHAYFGPIEKEDVRISQQSIADIFVIPADRSTDRYASMDVAAGGDVCVMMIWEGHTLIAIETSDRREPDEIEMWAAAMLTKYKVPVENFSFDASGSGFFMRRFKQGVPIISNTRPIIEYDEAGNKSVMEAYYTHRSQLLGKLEAALVKGEISCRIDKFMRFPHGPKRIQTTLLDILVEERNVFRRIDRNGKIYYRNKDEFKTSYKLSPDYIDAMAYRMVFDLDARPRKQKARVYGASDYRLVWDFDLPGM